MTIEPNIFEFATSELSQDAFLCYLMSFGKSEYKDTEEYKLVHSFLEQLKIKEDVEEIKRQENHIDVLILTKSYAVILEDKTFSKEHSEQLKRYEEKCKNNYPNKEVKLLYFKTGYTDIQEADNFEKKGIYIFDIGIITKLMNDYLGDNMVVKMWKEHIEKISKDIAEAKEIIVNVEQLNTYYKLSNTNSDMLQKDVYLDKLTRRFKEKFNDVYWYRAGQGRTPHICFQDTYFKCSCSERCKIHFGIYVMFRKEPQIVVKQHFYTIPEKRRLRLREYHKYGEELKSLQEMKHKFQQSILSDAGWEKKNENKDKLIILEKKVSNIEECIKDIKELQEIINSMGTPIDNLS